MTTSPSPAGHRALAQVVGDANTRSADDLLKVEPQSPSVLTWDYAVSRPALVRLYEQACAAQWRADDLPWNVEVDPARLASSEATRFGGVDAGADLTGTSFERWDEAEWTRLSIEAQNWLLSQFLHGEQAALVSAAKLVETVPWIDAKFVAATQVIDEARHVDVFTRYLDDKLSGHYQVNEHIRAVFDDIIGDARWDVTCLGMQVLVEGFALAAYRAIRQLIDEPLLSELLRRVMADEVRHVTFAMHALAEVYEELTEAEVQERQEFVYDVTLRMRDRFLLQEVWHRLDIDVADATRLLAQSPETESFQHVLFARIVPSCSELGLLDAGDGWLRERFTDLGIIGFEYTSCQE